MFKYMRNFMRSKTMWFAWLVMVFGVVEVNLHLIRDYLGDAYGIIFMIIAIISGTLRIYTTIPLHQKSKK